MDEADVEAARRLVLDLVGSLAPGDWTAPVPDLDGAVGQVVGHVAQVCLWYSIDLAARGRELASIDMGVASDGDPGDLLATLETTSGLLARVVATSGPHDRVFHPFGLSDRSGVAAMGCDELLVHGRDIALATDRDLCPSDDLAARVLGRLFPWVDAGSEPWTALLWANGRIEWGDRPRLEHWRWHAGPLDEWDGTNPSP